jgi:fructuronate reductase
MKLLRSANNYPVAPIRIVHIGLGAFHRAHQAWYTHKVDIENQWGIAAFTGRSPEAAEKLNSQENLYTLIERGSIADRFEVISSISATFDIDNYWQLKELIADPLVSIVSLTITESGYNFNLTGGLDRENSLVDEDIENLSIDDYIPHTVLFKVVGGLLKRYKLNKKPIAILSCDNLSANGVKLQAAMSDIFSFLPHEIDQWFKESVTFPSTSVDRITPKTTDDDIQSLFRATGIEDCTPVVTEPFSNWIIQGDFPAGRPAWEAAGAVFVDKIEDFENRKLWLLNGAHSLMAYAGLNSNLVTVADAMKSNEIRNQVEEFWNEASVLLINPELNIQSYREALVSRFENHRIEHQLSQIAMDGGTKLAIRVVPVIKGNLAKGDFPKASAQVIASWIAYLTSRNDIADSRSEEIKRALAENYPVKECINLLDRSLSENETFVNYVKKLIDNREAQIA